MGIPYEMSMEMRHSRTIISKSKARGTEFPFFVRSSLKAGTSRLEMSMSIRNVGIPYDILLEMRHSKGIISNYKVRASEFLITAL